MGDDKAVAALAHDEGAGDKWGYYGGGGQQQQQVREK